MPMPHYRVFYTAVFERKIEKMEKDFKEWLEKLLDKIVENPYAGKPLNVKWFREKKFGKYRVYFLVYENVKAVYFVNLSEKKDQQQIINSINMLLDMYRGEIENLVNK